MVDTRQRILRAAERLFVERGYHAATLREVAEHVGITKPALYYHFPSKSAILASLLDPMTTALSEVLAEASAIQESSGTAAARTVLLTRWADIFLDARGALVALIRDVAATPPETLDRFLSVIEEAVDIGAGPDAGVAERLAIAQAISAITDPVALMPGVPTEELRKHLLTGVWRLVGEPTARDGRGGRPRALSTADADRARELHASGQHTAESIARELGVSRATVYRYLKT